ncbi:MAG TPA: hypothetical protein VLK29_13060 [Luteimonas sp.]|nr:hypothetical protein [Luteimonas sp.]
MFRSRLLRTALLLPIAASAIYGIQLAVSLTLRALRAGTPESLMLAWVFAFVIVLPVLMAGLAAAGHWGRMHTVPYLGVKIPGVGQ